MRANIPGTGEGVAETRRRWEETISMDRSISPNKFRSDSPTKFCSLPAADPGDISKNRGQLSGGSIPTAATNKPTMAPAATQALKTTNPVARPFAAAQPTAASLARSGNTLVPSQTGMRRAPSQTGMRPKSRVAEAPTNAARPTSRIPETGSTIAGGNTLPPRSRSRMFQGMGGAGHGQNTVTGTSMVGRGQIRSLRHEGTSGQPVRLDKDGNMIEEGGYLQKRVSKF